MAKVIKVWPGRGLDGKEYPWNEWLDGRIWELKQGVDFTCPASTMSCTIRSSASRKGKRAKVQVSKDKTIVTLRATKIEDS
jgi:hypothetical protein